MHTGQKVRFVDPLRLSAALAALLLVFLGSWRDGAQAAGSSALSDEPIPLKSLEELPARTAPILEIGPDFLGTGNIPEGFELPTGAVWTPSLWVFGDYRTAFNYFDSRVDDEGTLEWANRLDLFFNLQLTGTERILLGFETLHNNNEYSGYIFEPDGRDGLENGLNPDVETLFFEGEFGEIFPNLDPEDTGAFDLGFAVGRQPIFFQDGIMFNDRIDAVGITRDTVMFKDISVDTRVTGLFGWNKIDRDDNREDNDAYLFGLFTETDFDWSTTNLDVAYVLSDRAADGDGFYVGASGTQRIGLINTTFRANASVALDEESEAVSTGGLLFGELSFTPARTDDVAYANLFWGIDNFASAARDELTGGPLGRVGLLFASVGLGSYVAPLSNRADDVAGGSVGYQKFWNSHRTQVVLELGGRKGTEPEVDDAAAIGARFQQAIGRRVILRLDGFARWQENLDEGFGARTELLVRF